jgi:hypothetical protein
MTPVFTTILTMAIVIAVSLALIIILQIRKEQKANELLLDFYGLAARFNFTLTREDVIGNRVIALDDTNNKLLFFSKTKRMQEGYLVDLGELKSSTVKTEYGLSNAYSKYHPNWQPGIEKIALQLHYKNGAKPLALTFYEKLSDQNNEMRLRAAKAFEWEKLVTKRLRKEYGVVKFQNDQLRA